MTTNSQAAPAVTDRLSPLIDKYEKWLAETGYKPMSADELLHELLVDDFGNSEHRRWLRAFIAEWEEASRPAPQDMDFDEAKKIVLDLARQNVAPEDMPALRKLQLEACDVIEELAVNFHTTA